MNKDELYSNLICALTHNLEVCEQCKKCKFGNSAEIRMGLVEELSEYMEKELPWENKQC